MIDLEILPEKNVIDDGFLDLIGGEFATHEQGLAEWLKNASDAMLVADATPRFGTILLRFTDGQAATSAVFECIDFVGMTLQDIETGFKPWGKLSGHDERLGISGGYGIGGKFYMRQMFESSYLIAYSRGHVNIFGFDRNHAYGYGHGYRNRIMGFQKALGLADIDSLDRIDTVGDAGTSGRRGFSVFRGIGPKGIGKKIDVITICQRLRSHPQAQRPLKLYRVCVIHNGVVVIERLKARRIPRKPGFERPWVRRIPMTLVRKNGTTGDVAHLGRYSGISGTLRLFVSSESLVQRGKMASLNRIDFMGRDGVIASYRIDELGVDVPYGESIFGECSLPEWDASEGYPAVKTRDRLVDSPESRALLQWVGAQVKLFSQMILQRAPEPRGEVDPAGGELARSGE